MNPLRDASKVVRDALYVGVGFGLLGVNRVQVQRRELERNLRNSPIGDLLGLRGGHGTSDR
jgi:hypothetical protein